MVGDGRWRTRDLERMKRPPGHPIVIAIEPGSAVALTSRRHKHVGETDRDRITLPQAGADGY